MLHLFFTNFEITASNLVMKKVVDILTVKIYN